MPNSAEMGPWCAEVWPQSKEPLAGSAAAQVKTWLLVEICGRWGAKPPADCGVPPHAEALLGEVLARRPGARLQLIRRPGSGGPQRDTRAFFVSRAGYEPMARSELFGLSVDELVAKLAQHDGSHTQGSPALHQAPLYLVCTHGTRDRCCAKWGKTLYAALADRPELTGRVWQTSHLGGHRFAPTFVSLPSALCYGRIDVADTPALMSILAASESGQLGPAAHLRGPCHEDLRGQLAWCAAARLWPERAWRGLTLDRERPDSRGRQRITVREGAASLHFDLRPGSGALEVLGSCGSDKPKRVEPLEIEHIRG